jgi:hypothetical protein
MTGDADAPNGERQTPNTTPRRLRSKVLEMRNAQGWRLDETTRRDQTTKRAKTVVGLVASSKKRAWVKSKVV